MVIFRMSHASNLFARDCKNILRNWADRKITGEEREKYFRLAEFRLREDCEQMELFGKQK